MFFVELLDKYRILIPKIQRDYAQGRAKYNKNGVEITSEKPYQVRVGLVNALYDGIDLKKRVDLNFVYGKRMTIDGKEVFIPIDGQQRLTTLFLFHWYICQRSGLADRIKALGESFSYDTRDTTKEFCRELCSNIMWNDSDNDRITNLTNSKDEHKTPFRLSSQIMDRIWFTSSYANDPSVKSMLIMIDSIEEKFALSEKYNSSDDFKQIFDCLASEDCPITFSYLDVENFDDEDMYIKMNARGKELTNFEIFKARLEEANTLLGVCYEENDSAPDRLQKMAEFIGKYNNEITNLFYGMQEIGKDYYDVAMFHFVECFLKYDHFAHITGYTKVSEDYYYSDFSNTNYTGASLFNDYILNPTLHGYKKENSDGYVIELNKKAKDSIVKITSILTFFVCQGFDKLPEYKNTLVDNGIAFDEKQLFISNIRDASNNVLVKQYALFSFLYLFDCIDDLDNKVDAYKEWKRFVFNITYRFTVKDPVNFAKMVGIFDAILAELHKKYIDNQNMISCYDVLYVIKDYNNISAIKNMSMEVIRHLFESESRKANLMIDKVDGLEWSRCIRNAEAYYDDGNVDFIFSVIDSNMSPVQFEKTFNNSKNWIDNKKNPIDCVAFNEALLCLDYDHEYERTAHLKVYYYDEVWQLFVGKQSNLREALLTGDRGKAIGLQHGVKKLLMLYDPTLSPREYADNLINSYVPKNDAWLRNILISERLVEKIVKYNSVWSFSGTIGRWSSSKPNEYIIFYATAYNSGNLELNTFRLAMKLIDKNPEVSIEKVMSGKPRSKEIRYVMLNDKMVCYDVDKQLFYNIKAGTYFTSNNNDNGMDEAIKYLTA